MHPAQPQKDLDPLGVDLNEIAWRAGAIGPRFALGVGSQDTAVPALLGADHGRFLQLPGGAQARQRAADRRDRGVQPLPLQQGM